MKRKPLIIYLILVFTLSIAFVLIMRTLEQQALYLAQVYMFLPAISAVIVRIFFYKKKFKDAYLKLGKFSQYLKYWTLTLGITILSYVIFTVLGSVEWDFTGAAFLDRLAEQLSAVGQDINDLPEGLTPQIMLLIFFIGGLTTFNIPGIISGLGEELGWRGFMFPQLYKIKPWMGLILGGVIWFAWHIPLSFVLPQTQKFSVSEIVLNVIILGIGSILSFIFFSYVFVKSRSIFIVSFAHIVFNNASQSFGYYVTITNQLLANLGLTITMAIAIAVLYYSGEFKYFDLFFKKPKK